MNARVLSDLGGMASLYINRDHGAPTAENIRGVLFDLRALPLFDGQVSDEEIEQLARQLEEKLGISMGLGAVVDSEDFRPWLDDARINGDVGNFYWARYRQLLSKKDLPPDVIEVTHKVTDKILDRLGDPRSDGRWSRRGMVVGHVQSGKTANYTGLICKAADAGYRLIVVIAGIHNNLRNQTQARIDEGFIGRDTGRLAHANKAQRQKIIGVGEFDQRDFPVSLTNTLKDFNKATATTNTSQIGQYNVPVILVIKKNTHTLKNLIEWLKEHSVHQHTQMSSQPMLLIDDEADNASINTAYDKDKVTRINGQIRELLSIFERSCYVGYTATPFANIFIDPDTDDDTLKQDLFPRHFIIGLDAPSNYFGSQKVFIDGRTEDDEFEYLRVISDHVDLLPLKHPISLEVNVIPESLKQAIRLFIVARAIRNLRGQRSAHASMLVNASRFTDVQGKLRARISEVISNIRDAVQIDGAKGMNAIKNPEIARLHEAWKSEYGTTCDESWADVQKQLHAVTAGLKVIEVNASKRSEPLDYDSAGENGITVIAVGGFSLSRGLTLEGLMISYFLRNSMMYDTLMQMGRWFGYRSGYEDLCRVWMPANSIGWYAHIHEAMDDLQDQMKRMEMARATPEQFGLAVRSHPESLMVTARNKMGTGRLLPMRVSLAEHLVETTRIQADVKQLKRNILAGENLVNSIRELGLNLEERPNGFLSRGAGVDLILQLLREYVCDKSDPPANPLTDPKLISDYITARADKELAIWDIFFASSTRKDIEVRNLSGLPLKPFVRSVDREAYEEGGAIAISGASRRVGSSYDEKEGLTPEQIATAIKAFKDDRKADNKPVTSNINPRYYRKVPGRRPLLILRFVRPTIAESGQNYDIDDLLVWGLSFPTSKIEGGKVDYVVNTIRLRELYGEGDFDEEEEMNGDSD